MGKIKKNPVRDPLEGLGAEYEEIGCGHEESIKDAAEHEDFLRREIESLELKLIQSNNERDSHKALSDESYKMALDFRGCLELCQASKSELEKQFEQAREVYLASLSRLDRTHNERLVDLKKQITEERNLSGYLHIAYYFIALCVTLLLHKILV